MEGVTIPIPALAEEEAEEWRAGILPHGSGTVHLLRGTWERGLIAITPYWVVVRLTRPTEAGVTCRAYPVREVERVDFDDA